MASNQHFSIPMEHPRKVFLAGLAVSVFGLKSTGLNCILINPNVSIGTKESARNLPGVGPIHSPGLQACDWTIILGHRSVSSYKEEARRKSPWKPLFYQRNHVCRKAPRCSHPSSFPGEISTAYKEPSNSHRYQRTQSNSYPSHLNIK